MLASLTTSFFGVLTFLYIFWKRLKEDYAPSIIFSVSFYILVGILAGWFAANRLFPSWFFWASGLGAVVGFALGILRLKLRLYESFEALAIAVLPWLSFTFLNDSVSNSRLTSFLAFLVVLALIYVFYYLDTHFREFTWYASGKVGFSGLATLAILFLVRTATSLAGLSVLSFIDNLKVEAAFSGVAALLCFVLLFNLSRKIE